MTKREKDQQEGTAPMVRLARLNANREVRHAKQICYSVKMVAAIAAERDHAVDRDEFLPAACMLDAFYVHIRLITEFFLRPTKKVDFGPRDFDVDWTCPTGEGPDRLNDSWGLASRYVVHFGRPRVPESLEDLNEFGVNSTYFRELAGDALDCFGLFVDSVERAAPSWNRGAYLPDPVDEPELWRARTSNEVLNTLRSARDFAARRLAT